MVLNYKEYAIRKNEIFIISTTYAVIASDSNMTKDLPHCRKQTRASVLFLRAEKFLYRRQYNTEQTRNLKFKYETESQNSATHLKMCTCFFFLRTRADDID